jgi:transposase-like protein
MSRTFYRYSLAFRQKVVSEIESGKLTYSEAQRIYGITGCETIPNWVKKFGKNHLLNKVVRIQMKDEKDEIKELRRQKRELESALAQAHVKNIVLEGLIEAASEHYGTDLKKNFGAKASKKVSNKRKDED